MYLPTKMMTESAELRIEFVRDEDVSTSIDIIVRAFAAFPFEQALGNTDDEESRKAAQQRHLRAWNEHFEDTGIWPAIRCVHADSGTGKETTVACAEWYIYPKPIPRNDLRGPSYLLSGVWLPDEQREKIQRTFRPPLDLRAQWTAGRAHGLLIFMATDPAWRRRGAATMCVQWGIDKCKELGIPAYLEASKEGAPVYQRLGFEVLEGVHMELDGKSFDFPALMWWPPGTRDEDKRKLAG